MGQAGKDVGGFISDPFGSRAANDAANAATNAGMAQQREAGRQFGIMQGYRQDTINATEGLTLESMANMDKAIQAQERSLSRSEQMISNIDPTILEASTQALKLLRGEQSSTLNPLKSQRDQQRMKLLNSLREQLGPGAETSTAGMQALSRFDMETDTLFAGAQQNALQTVGQIFGQFNSGRPDMVREAGAYANLVDGRANLRFKQQNLINGLNQGVMGAGQMMIGAAGAEYTGDLMRAQHRQSLNGKFMDAAIQGGTAYATGGASLMKPPGGNDPINPKTADKMVP